MSLFRRIPKDTHRTLQNALQERDDAQRERDAVTAQLAAAQAEIAHLGKQLSNTSFVADRLSADVDRLTAENRILGGAVDELPVPVTAVPVQMECVCGGDAELHLRRQVVVAEHWASRDRANAVVMANQLADMRNRLDAGNSRIHYRSLR